MFGCAPGLSTTRIEGIATYATAKQQFNDAKQRFVGAELDKTPEWKSISGTGSLAAIELKFALAKGSEKEVYQLTKELVEATQRTDKRHLRAVYLVNRIDSSLKAIETELKAFNLNNDPKWVAARNSLITGKAFLAVAVIEGTNETFIKVMDDFEKTVINASTVYSTLIRNAQTAKDCANVKCAAGSTCTSRWNEAICIDVDKKISRPLENK